MIHSAPVAGLLDAELAYRRERLAADVATSRRLVSWVQRLRRRSATPAEELTLAA